MRRRRLGFGGPPHSRPSRHRVGGSVRRRVGIGRPKKMSHGGIISANWDKVKPSPFGPGSKPFPGGAKPIKRLNRAWKSVLNFRRANAKSRLWGRYSHRLPVPPRESKGLSKNRNNRGQYVV